MILNKSDWIGIIAIAIMLIGSSLIIYYYTTEKINSCTKDPIKFAADKLSEGKDYNYVYFEVKVNPEDILPISRRQIDLTNYSNLK